MKPATMLILVVPIIVAAIWLVPLALIWALNTLFHTDIGYSWSTWAAALLLASMATAGASRRS